MQKIVCVVLFALFCTIPCIAQSVTLPIIENNPQKGRTENAPLDMKQLHQGHAIDLMQAGKLDEAIQEAEMALEEAKTSAGERPIDKQIIASCYSVLGKVYRRKDRYDESLKAYQQALDYWNKQDSGRNWVAAMILNNMGEEYKSMNQPDKALPLLLEAKARVGDEKEPSYCAIMENLGTVYILQKNFLEAEQSLKKAVETAHKGNDRRSEVDSMGVLAVVYLKQGHLEDAKSQIDKASSVSELHFGPTSSHTTDLKKVQAMIQNQSVGAGDPGPEFRSFFMAAKAAMEQHNDLQAISSFQSALEIVEKKQPDSAAMAATLSGLGAAYLRMGAFKKAEDTLTRAIPLYEKWFGDKPELIAAIRQGLETAKAKQQP